MTKTCLAIGGFIALCALLPVSIVYADACGNGALTIPNPSNCLTHTTSVCSCDCLDIGQGTFEGWLSISPSSIRTCFNKSDAGGDAACSILGGVTQTCGTGFVYSSCDDCAIQQNGAPFTVTTDEVT